MTQSASDQVRDRTLHSRARSVPACRLGLRYRPHPCSNLASHRHTRAGAGFSAGCAGFGGGGPLHPCNHAGHQWRTSGNHELPYCEPWHRARSGLTHQRSVGRRRNNSCDTRAPAWIDRFLCHYHYDVAD